MPVRAADPVRLDADQRAVRRGCRIGHLADDERLADSLEDGGAHGKPPRLGLPSYTSLLLTVNPASRRLARTVARMVEQRARMGSRRKEGHVVRMTLGLAGMLIGATA